MLTQCWGLSPTDEQVIIEGLAVSASLMAIAFVSVATAKGVVRRHVGPRVSSALSQAVLILGLLLGGLLVQIGYVAEIAPPY